MDRRLVLELKAELITICIKYGIELHASEDDPETFVVDKLSGNTIFKFNRITNIGIQ